MIIINDLFIASSAASFEIMNHESYYTGYEYDLYLNDKYIKTLNTNVFSVFDLIPNREYEVKIVKKETHETGSFSFKTSKVKYYASVKDFGAKGDGVFDDTLAINTCIQCVPSGSLVIIPEGTYKITSIYPKCNIEIYLKKNATLIASNERSDYPIIPRVIHSNDDSDRVLGTWEGNPNEMFSSPITIINKENVKLYGEGTIDGGSLNADWWVNEKKKTGGAFRPRGIFIGYSKNIDLMGIEVKNTASWTIHPFNSDDLNFIDLRIENPDPSPNTDGLNPESCINVNIIGTKFNVGDDCISIKSGKIYMAKNYYKESRHITIRNCFMDHGHGAIVLGSEMASGIYGLHVRQCLFSGTDRGLRIKTRRGRGKRAIIDNVEFTNIKMENVKNPFTINMFYQCDPDGFSEYVYGKKVFPVDDRTPYLGKFKFKDIVAKDSLVSACYIYGLPEMPIEEVVFENVDINIIENDIKMKPCMMADAVDVNMCGMFISNCKKVELINTNITGQKGEKFIINNVNEIKGDK